MAETKLSIVVPTLDEAPRIRAALTQLAPLRAAGHEAIVVDGGSRDATGELASPLADRVLTAPRGRAIQMNVGASVAQGDALLFLHADGTLPKNAADAIGRSLDGRRRWGYFDVELEGASAELKLVAALMNLRTRASGICTGDQGMFIARDLFEAAGGFSPIALMEDVAMSKTLNTIAGRPASIPDRMRVSGRRWDERGAWRTILQMWALRYAFWRGTDPESLAVRYYGRTPSRTPTLQIFAKAPIAGRVKTRLADAIGENAAANVYRRLVDRTLGTAIAARRAGVVHDLELWVAGDLDRSAYERWCAEHDVGLHVQGAGDLGERMHGAIRSVLRRARPALLIGTDVPGYDIAYLAAAAAALQSSDAVLGPAEDGGYVLLGVARDIAVFSGIAWSTSAVLADTRAKLAAEQASWHELPVLWDVDTVDDLKRWQRIGGIPSESLVW